MTTRNGILARAASQIGYREGTGYNGRSNWTKYWAELKPEYQGGAWCAAFVCWVLKQEGSTLMLTGPSAPYYTPSMEAWAKKTGRWRESKDCQPGDVLIFGSGSHATHTGFLVAQDGSNVITIEGNTSNGSGGSQTDGGGVYRRRRPRSFVRGCIDISSEITRPAAARSDLLVLVGKGRARIDADGELGPQTRTAFEWYQGLKVDGSWDRMDVRALQSWASRPRTGVLSRDDVRAVQRKLAVGADGEWGPKTTVAFQNFLNRRIDDANRKQDTKRP